jgi:glyoxylase-like metal-dependent hydrolase (beta-lactamase superfamily II)
MKKILLACGAMLLLVTSFAQLPPQVPIWDANKVELKLQKIADDVYAIIPATAAIETTKGIPQATTGGFIVGEKGVLLIEVMLTKRLYDQEIKLVRSVTDKPIIYAVNTSDHGDHCFSNYLLPAPTIIIQNEFAKDNLAKNYNYIKEFMVNLFGKDRGIENTIYRAADIAVPKNSNLKIDLGKGKIIEFINTGTKAPAFPGCLMVISWSQPLI